MWKGKSSVSLLIQLPHSNYSHCLDIVLESHQMPIIVYSSRKEKGFSLTITTFLKFSILF